MVLELRGVTSGRVKGASLRVRAGEIVGVAGVDGNGQGELVQAIIGGAAVEAGTVSMDGREATGKSIRWRMERLAYIAEDRQRQAVVLPLSIQNNLMLKAYRRERFSTMGWLRFGMWRERSRALVERFDVRCGSVAETVGSLSGGNQQKVVVARELSEKGKRLVVAVNPTRGLDVGATAFVMRQLLAARERGAGVLLVHSDLDELLAISDRVMVLFGGALRESGWPKETKERIGRMMMGVSA
jgi:simple sugar transport system ATP-binding protein